MKRILAVLVFVVLVGVAIVIFAFSYQRNQNASQKPPVIDYFACGDNCPGPREQYMKRVYQNIHTAEECTKLGGTLYTYVAWTEVTLCLAK